MASRWLHHFSLLLFLFASSLFASGPTGTVTGTIKDPSGAVIPKAHVIVTNEETNAARSAQTNDDGDYTVALLPIGRYRVAVECAGFRRSVLRGVIVDVDQTVRVDFALHVGAITEEVRVTDTPPIVQTDTSTLGQVVNERLVEDLPLNQRNFLSFALLVPGAQLPTQGSENSTQGGSFNVNGARDQSNNFMLDGVDNNDPYLNQYVALPSIDAIQEFKVQSGDYSAEFGHASGAQINMVLRSGTNAFHGGLFEFLRNRTMDAKNYFDLPDCTASLVASDIACASIPRFDRNQFGGTLGGPLRKDKTFFFFSDEQLRLRQATTREATIPSQTQWQAAEALAGIITTFMPCPAATGPCVNGMASGMSVMNLYPAANVVTNVGSDLTTSNTFLSAPVIDESLNLISVKVDEQANPNDRISMHYSLTDENRFDPFDPVNSFTSLPGYGSDTSVFGQNAGVDWTRVFRSSLVNEFRLGFTRMGATFLQQNHGVNIESQLGFPDALTNPIDLGAPNINLSANLTSQQCGNPNGCSISFNGIGAPIQYPENRRDNTYQISDNLAWTVRQNQFKIGADFRRFQLGNYIDYEARGDWFFQGQTMDGLLQQFYYNGLIQNPYPCNGTPLNYSIPGIPNPNIDVGACVLAQLLLGIPDNAIDASGTTNSDLLSHGVSAYVQDDIHVVPRFLLNVGLRYEFNTPPVEAHNQFSVPVLTPCPETSCIPFAATYTQAGTDGIPRATYYPTRRDIAPRIGIAWRPMKSERWVVRSAYGIFYDEAIGQINVFPRANPPLYDIAAFCQTVGCQESGPPACPGGLCYVQDIFNQPGYTSQSEMIDPHFRDGYMQQWNLDLQYELMPNWMIDLAYVGSKGTHLTTFIDRNQQNPVTGYPFSQFSSIFYIESASASSYHSMQFRTERRVTRGLAFLGAYTWSRSIDDLSNIFGGSVGSGQPQNSQNLRGDNGPSDFNATHRLSFSAVYNLPFDRFRAKNSTWSKALLANWQAGGIFSAQSGSPFTVVLAGAPSAAAAAFGNPERPNLVGNPNKPGQVDANPTCQAPTQIRTTQNWFNQCAFETPNQNQFTDALGNPISVYEYGTEGRNALIGPAFADLDFSLSKSFPLHVDSQRVLLRAEVFNLLNHPSFDTPYHVLNMTPCVPSNGLSCAAENFGAILSVNSYGNKPPRQIQMSFKYNF
jgi:hypothetical protein